MAIKLYGNSLSTCTKRVATVLREKNVPFEFHSVDFAKGEHKAPAYLEKQPFGQVPYLEDDGFVVYESRAISRYIAEKYADQGTKLIPTDLKERAIFEQALSVEAFNFDPSASKIVFEKVFKPLYGGVADEGVFKALDETLKNKLAVYDKILSKQNYLAGDSVTLADLHHIPYGVLLSVAGSNRISEYPNVERWFKSLTERESWIAVKDGVKSFSG